MCMIQKPSKLLPLLAFVVFCAMTGSAVAAEWPRTFQGQPDFDFTREEVVTELNEKADELGYPPFIATVEDIQNARRIDPFDPRPRYRRDAQPGAAGETRNPFLPTQLLTTTETAAAAGAIDGGTELITPEFDGLNNAVQLPDEKLIRLVDEVSIAELKTFLNAAIDKARAEQQMDLSTINLQPEVDSLQLATLSRSPVPYAIINNQRFEPGDTFPLQLQIKPQAIDYETVINQHQPKNFSPNSEIAQAFLQAKQEVIAAQPEVADKIVNRNVTVTVQAIETQRVILNIMGREYPLVWRMRL